MAWGSGKAVSDWFSSLAKACIQAASRGPSSRQITTELPAKASIRVNVAGMGRSGVEHPL